MGCGDIGVRLVKEAVKYGVEIGIEKLARQPGCRSRSRKGSPASSDSSSTERGKNMNCHDFHTSTDTWQPQSQRTRRMAGVVAQGHG